MRFCSSCGHPVERRIPPGDHLPRFVCPRCRTVHYQNPRIIVGTLPLWEGQVLLCRRAIPPRIGFWTLPAGFLECDESTSTAAQRETVEEAGARVTIVRLYALIDAPHIQQVHLFYHAILRDRAWAPGGETLELRLFTPRQIPWDELAFATVRSVLRYWAEKGAHAPTPLVAVLPPTPPFPST
ncbi:MAG: NUDIX hydrolase [Hydrogenophilus sp.]|nr:NUDIX hydrolase [Hydrogenophilus sp.]